MRFPCPGPGNPALWCRRSTDMPLCLCPSVHEILPFPRIRGPPFFLGPSPTVKLHLPPPSSPSSRIYRILGENNIAPHLVKIYLRCHTMITSFAWETDLIHRLDDIRSQTATGEENIQCWFYIHIYIYIGVARI